MDFYFLYLIEKIKITKKTKNYIDLDKDPF